jgi:glycosyltransferase involved in cell wall biosynthesis
MLIRRGCQKIILYICRPRFGPALHSIPFDLSCYHIDDEYSFSEVEVPPDPAEMSLIANVNQVFIHSPGLMEKKGSINPQTTFIPNGVDFTGYANPAPEPTDLFVIPHPRILYTGYIKKQLDWPLMLELARRHREWSFVFIGPTSPHPEIIPVIQEISSYPNVYFLGAKSAQALTAYPQHFEACIMPYRVDAYTNNIYPLKLHEYLASGRPIVSVPIRTLRDFSKVVTLASGVDEWSGALTRALEPAAISPEVVAARRNIAREYDWDNLTHLIAQTLCERMGSDYVYRLQEIASGHRDQDTHYAVSVH